MNNRHEFDQFREITVNSDAKINFALLEAVASHIERHPSEFNMTNWGGIECVPTKWDWIVAKFGIRPLPTPVTVGCIACHTVSLNGGDIESSSPAIAQEMLGISDQQALALFYHDNWPEPYKAEFAFCHEVDDTTGMAWMASRRIRHFIATNGAE